MPIKPQKPASLDITENELRHREIIARFFPKEKETLLGALTAQFPSWSRNTIKQKLRDRCITVSGTTTTQFDMEVTPQSEIVLYAVGEAPKINHPLVKEVYIDECFIVLYKSEGIPTVAVNKDAQKTLFRIVANHLKSFNPKEKVFLLNRLDKETAGFIVMARNREVQQWAIDNWSHFMLDNQFGAIIKGSMPEEKGLLEREGQSKSKNKRSKGMAEGHRGFRASYTVEKETPFTQWIRVSLLSRNNAIRSFLAEQETPVVGDKRTLSWNAPTFGLVGTSLVFWHPIQKKRISFAQEPPKSFLKLLYLKLTRREKEQFNTEK